jgi:hypothetical protein
LKYAYKDGAGWHLVTVDSRSYVAEDTSIQLDTNGYPHISYSGPDSNSLECAFQDGFGWHLFIIDNTAQRGKYNALALDEFGYSHFVYYDSTAYDLLSTYIIPPSNLTIDGPDVSYPYRAEYFTATIAPSSAMYPFDYMWQSPENSTITATGYLSYTTSLMWNILGSKIITVTAANPAGSVMATHAVTIKDYLRFYLPIIGK